MKHEDMNTLNPDVKAFNGNYKAVLVAAFFLSMAFFGGLTHLFLMVFQK